MAKAVKRRELDIFDLLSAIDRRDREYLDRQTTEAKKEFLPPVALRWTSAVRGAAAVDYLIATNEFANIGFHDLYEYPDLQYRLLTLTGAGRSQRHEWVPVSRQAKINTVLEEFVGRFYPCASMAEIEMLLGKSTLESFEDFVNRCGCSPEEAKEIVGAYKKANSKKS